MANGEDKKMSFKYSGFEKLTFPSIYKSIVFAAFKKQGTIFIKMILEVIK